MVKFFIRKKTKEDIDAEYAAALDGLNATLNGQNPPPLEDDNTHDQPDASLLNSNLENTKRGLASTKQQIETIAKLHPETKPLMTRALNALNNATKNPSSKNIRELFYASQAVSRFKDVRPELAAPLGKLAASMAGVGMGLWLTSIIIAATVSSAMVLPITFAVGTALILGAAVISLYAANQHYSSRTPKDSRLSGLAEGIKEIKATLSRL